MENEGGGSSRSVMVPELPETLSVTTILDSPRVLDGVPPSGPPILAPITGAKGGKVVGKPTVPLDSAASQDPNSSRLDFTPISRTLRASSVDGVFSARTAEDGYRSAELCRVNSGARLERTNSGESQLSFSTNHSLLDHSIPTSSRPTTVEPSRQPRDTPSPSGRGSPQQGRVSPIAFANYTVGKDTSSRSSEIRDRLDSPQAQPAKGSTGNNSQHLDNGVGNEVTAYSEADKPPLAREAFGVQGKTPKPRRQRTNEARKSLYSPPEPEDPLWIKILRPISKVCRRVAEASIFNNFITLVIVIASVTVGMSTYEQMEGVAALESLDFVILIIFTCECVIKIFAYYLRPWAYFYDNWNKFDFAVVFICYMPIDRSMVTILRLARLLRVLKLVKALPELQVLVMGLLASLPSIFYVGLLLGLVFYLYAVLCITMFKSNDPVHFHDLQSTFLTLFRIATFEDWTDIMYSQMHGCEEYGLPYYQKKCRRPRKMGWLPSVVFVSFIFMASFTVLNLFIGVISASMDEAKADLEDKKEKKGADKIDDGESEGIDKDQAHYDAVLKQIEELETRLSKSTEKLGEVTGEIVEVMKFMQEAKKQRIIYQYRYNKKREKKKTIQRTWVSSFLNLRIIKALTGRGGKSGEEKNPKVISPGGSAASTPPATSPERSPS